MKNTKIVRWIFPGIILGSAGLLIWTGCNQGGGGGPQPSANPPSAPAFISATKGVFTDRVKISWTPSVGATVYQVWRSLNQLNYTQLSGTVATTSYDDTTAEAGKTYYYRVKAGNAAGFSALSISFDSGYVGGNPPPKPESVQASRGEFYEKIHITWLPIPEATHYRLFRTTTPADPNSWVQLDGDLTLNVYDDTAGLQGGISYFYRVQAFNLYGASPESEPAQGFLNTSPVSPPLTVSATDGEFTNKVVVSWSAVANATCYQVYRAPAPSGPYAPINAFTTTTAYEDQDPVLQPAQSYYYRVKSGREINNTCDNQFLGDLSAAVDEGWKKPLPPTNVQASDGDFPNVIRISWVSDQNATYEVFRSLTQTPDSSYSIIVSTGAKLYDDPVPPGSQFYYRVRVVMNNRASDLSAPDVGTTSAVETPPAVPTGVSATDGLYDDRVDISYNPVPNATFYRFYRSRQNPPSGFQAIGEVASPAVTFSDTTALQGVQYSYYVRAGNPIGLSDPSTSDPGWRKPVKPSNVQASRGAYVDPNGNLIDTAIKITWDPVSGFNLYKVYRTQAPVPPSPNDLFIATPNVNEYEDSQVSQSVVYYYWVKTAGVDANLDSDFSECEVDLNTNELKCWGFAGGVPPVPPAPTGVQATDGDTTRPGTVRITWNVTPGAITYQVLRGDVPCNPSTVYTPISPDLPATQNYFDDVQPPAIIGTTFCYTVVAKNNFGSSPNASPDTGYAAPAAPNPPNFVCASDPNDPQGCAPFPDRVRVCWDSSFGASRYEVWRSINPTSGYVNIPGAPTGTVNCDSDPDLEFFFDDNSITPGSDYYFRVRAGVDTPSGTLWSDFKPTNGDLGRTSISAPSAPTSITASDGAFSDRIEVFWPLVTNPNAPGQYYHLYRSQSAFGPFLQIGSDLFPPGDSCTGLPPGSMCYWDLTTANGGNAVPGTVYWYKVEAFNPAGRSGLSSASDSGFASVVNTPPSAPQGVVLTPRPFPGGGTSMVLTWIANTEPDLDHYEIYKSTSSPVPVVDNNRIATVNKSAVSYTDSRPCDGDANFNEIDEVCYGGIYFYVVVAVDSGNLKSNPSSVVGAWASPPYKPSSWPRNATGWVKSSNTTGDLNTPPDNNDVREIAGADYGGRVYAFTRSGGNFAGTLFHPATWPIIQTDELVILNFIGDFPPSLPFFSYCDIPFPFPGQGGTVAFRSSPTMGILMDESGNNAGGDTHYCYLYYNPDENECFVSDNVAVDGTVDQQVIIGGQDAVYIIRSEGGTWGGSPHTLAAQLTTHQLGYFLGFVSATPTLLDVVNLQGDPVPDGYPEVAAASESGIIAIWRFLDVAGPQGYGAPDGRPDAMFIPFVNDPQCEPQSPVMLYTPPFLSGYPKQIGVPVRASPAVADIGQPNNPGGPDGYQDLIVAATNGCIYAWDASGRPVSQGGGEPIFGFPVCPTTSFRSSPTIADFDQNNCPEIILGADNGNIYLVECDGSFSQFFQTGGTVESSPAFADLNGDNFLDVVIGSDNGSIYAFDGLASMVALQGVLINDGVNDGWPFHTDDVVRASPSIADVDGDGEPDIIIGSFDGKLYALYWDGKNHPHTDPRDPLFNLCKPQIPSSQTPDNRCAIINGWPVDFGFPVFSSTAVDNLDQATGDNYVEITLGADDFRFHTLWTFPLTTSNNDVRWPAFRRNRCRPGSFYNATIQCSPP